MAKTTAKAGRLLCVDRGTYSDYGVVGFFVVLRDFEPAAELEAFLAEHTEQRKSYAFESDQFLAALLSKGLLLELDYDNLFMSSYDRASEVRFTPFSSGQC